MTADVTASLRRWKAGTYRQTEWTWEQRTESLTGRQVGSDGNPDRNNGEGIGLDCYVQSPYLKRVRFLPERLLRGAVRI